MSKVLWLVSWYPNDSDPFSGDFIKRQAIAVSLYQPIQVLYVGKRQEDSVRDKSNIVETANGLTESIRYYTARGQTKSISKWRSLYTYFSIHRLAIHQLKKAHALPDLVHVHVAMKAGLAALYLKWRYHIPYVVTEHWSGYYAESEHSLFKKSFIERLVIRRILRGASQFLPVSESLGRQVNAHWAKIPFIPIPNVVDTSLFFPAEESPQSPFRFIHVSSLVAMKNAEGIIHAFSQLVRNGYVADLVLVGPLNDSIKTQIAASGEARHRIVCVGEIPYAEVARELRKSSVLVLFSYYENQPCVILEALCTGIPVIAPQVGGIPEIINRSNGMLIDSGDEKQLTEAMETMMSEYGRYNRQKISADASARFSYRTVGKQIAEVYDSVRNNG